MQRGEPVLEIVNGLQEAVLGETKAHAQSCSITDALVELTDWRTQIEDGETPCISTGIPCLDSVLTGGLMNGGFYLLGGRPGGYKTALALNIALHAAKNGSRVLIVSLEMPRKQIAARLVAIDAVGLSASHVLSRRFTRRQEQERYLQSCSDLSKLPLILRCDPTNMQQLRSEVLRSNCDLLVLDYIGLMTDSSNASLYERMTERSKALKQLALQRNIPILCLAQLNRQSEGREDKKPALSDLRDSGSLEQDADSVLLLCKAGDMPDGAVTTTLPLIVAKNRHGRIAEFTLTVAPSNGRIFEERNWR